MTMPMTHEQKADLGERYIAEIKRRIEVRTAAQKKASDSKKEIRITKPASAELIAIAESIAKRRRLTISPENVDVDSERDGKGEYVQCLDIGCEGGVLLRLPLASPECAKVVAIVEENRRRQKLASYLCHEIQLLNHRLSDVGGFQAYSARLWAPADKSDRIPSQRLTALVDDFLASKRPAVCAA